MSGNPPVYYLSQALELHDTSSELETSLHIQTSERDWLRDLFLPSHDARQALDIPMSVDKLFLVAQGSPPADLAGTFLVSGPSGHSVFLCTPAFGLERFATRQLASSKLLERLKVSGQRDELLRFVPLGIRTAIRHAASPSLVAEPIHGVVLSERRQSIENYLDYTRTVLNNELLKLPTLKTLLNQLLENRLGKRFGQVSLSALRVISHVAPPADNQAAPLPSRPLSTRSLSEALLEHYRRGSWPEDQTREFVAPGYSASAADTLDWENALANIANHLDSHLKDPVKAFWEGTCDDGVPRRELFIDALGTRFRAELLQQEQDWNTLAPENFYWLSGLYPRDAARLNLITHYTLGIETDQRSSVLGNTFVVRNDRESPPGFFLYGAGRLQAFENEASLRAWVKVQVQDPGRNAGLHDGLALREAADLQGSTIARINLTATVSSAFEALFQTIIAKQLDNLEYILARYRASDGALALATAFESALDIRALLDPRLTTLASQGRWSHRLDLVPSENAQAALSPHALTPTLETVRYQLKTLGELKSTLTEGLKKRPTLRAFATSELSRELLLAHRVTPSPDTLYINHYASSLPVLGDTELQPERSQNLVEHFLERLTRQAGALPPATNTGLFSTDAEGNWSRIANLDITSLNTVIDRTLVDFSARYLRRQRAVYGELSEPLREAVTCGLRREAQFKELRGDLGRSDLELLDHLLDSQQRSSRGGLRGFIPDAFALTLRADASAMPIPLHNCFLLTERGGLSTEHSGAALLWTPAQGAEAFHSVHDAEVELQRRLHDPVERLSLLENIARGERPPKLAVAPNRNPHRRAYPALGFALIEDALRGDRQHSLIDKVLADLTHALTAPYSGENLHRHLQACLDAHLTIALLEKALQAAESTALHLALPPWLAGTTEHRQFALASLLDRYRQQAATIGDYHQDIPDIRDNARTRIISLLSRDFPATRLDPDKIRISLKRQDVTTSESLTDFALRHFDDIDQSLLIVRSLDGPFPQDLTANHLRTLVKEAAIGGHFANLLDAFLSGGREALTRRRPAFARHCYWQGLMHAFTQVIDNSLSAVAHGFIKHLLAMPDGLAREPLNGRRIDLRPLELISTTHAIPEPVAGFYMIGPPPDEPGPHILFSPQGTLPVFKEYADKATFIDDLKTSGELQRRILERLAHDKRDHYAQHVFAAQRAIMQISDNPVRGNLFHRLYQDTSALLKDMLGQQNVQDQGTVWSNVLSWLKGGLYQGQSQLLGRLRLPLLIWQTLTRLKDAADKGWQGRWSEAIEEFVVSLAQLAVARKGARGLEVASLTPTNGAAVVESPFPTPPWADSQLTPGQKSAILDHEAREVTLQDMTLDPATGLYRDATSQRVFVAVGGRVFEVQGDLRRWRIVKDQALGPWLKQGADKRWSFDLEGHCIEGSRP
ncbi:dermonecrotic toxin domain-containing protein [Pseudomonas gingeri]